MTREDVAALWKQMGWEDPQPALISAALVFYHRGYRAGVDEMTEKVFFRKPAGDQND